MQYCSDFKYDLKTGKTGEKLIGDLLSKKKIEVKTDKLTCMTGNIAVEFMCRGKLSGISTTRADFWCFIVEVKGNKDWMIFIRTRKLKTIARKYWEKGCIKQMGDNNMTDAVLIPVKELIREMNETY